MHEITELLRAWSNGDKEALNQLQPLVDDELKRLARNYMRAERPDHVLQTTALVHEALIKLIQENISWKDRKQFYGFVAKRMRQVLINYAANRDAQKRDWGERVNTTVAESQASPREKEVTDLEDALRDLAKIDENKVKIIEYRFFIGLTLEEIADNLGVSVKTVQREWHFSRAWLNQYLRSTAEVTQ
jgi:RNA polymerase sigma factor (TIGR02999 family)